MKTITVIAYLIAFGILFQGVKSCRKDSNVEQQCPIKLADCYILNIGVQDAQNLKDEVSATYEVRRQDAHHVDLVCETWKTSWFTTRTKLATITISFNPSSGSPYYGTCLEVDSNNRTERGSIKLVPTSSGGFTFTYWEDHSSQVNEGTLEPVWY
jgi:hypothetical protein